MAKLTSFTFISLNGFYKGMNEDISWHQHGGEEAEYSAENLKSSNILLFGRVTYEMMKSFWPTQMAYDSFPEVARGMNNSEKFVVSKSLKTADWKNTKIIKENLIEKITELKKSNNKNITLLGSGNVLKQLAKVNLIDEYQIMIDPIFIKNGESILDNLNENITLELTKSKVFKNGTILLYYKPRLI
ncbi:dihydrofolate reductase [Tenacibaculum discolor]|uniref:Dihydrofolate reductase n=1 Tax=Tenacibaculum discolor TaxID=361581 RepID=A0A2G1BYB1_9FLAO|nr:dihydrofolate reductase family protein [Tenacibaculum discolor]MDP2541301.1 dihydrofolate reductase family protein [Tenacibaculum discolor]PHN98997.1 dihydrofolate reductase [Tenacibaculum discolor]PHO01030.1 dihydrofolate reductase [Rhodobacteraceae bacterium 4F10]